MKQFKELKPLAYSIAEACTLSSVGRTTLYTAIARGDLKTRKVGRRTLITAQDLKSWIDSCTTERKGLLTLADSVGGSHE